MKKCPEVSRLREAADFRLRQRWGVASDDPKTFCLTKLCLCFRALWKIVFICLLSSFPPKAHNSIVFYSSHLPLQGVLLALIRRVRLTYQPIRPRCSSQILHEMRRVSAMAQYIWKRRCDRARLFSEFESSFSSI